jgi:hypothetical protein
MATANIPKRNILVFLMSRSFRPCKWKTNGVDKKCDELETQPRIVRTLAEIEVRCQANLEIVAMSEGMNVTRASLLLLTV